MTLDPERLKLRQAVSIRSHELSELTPEVKKSAVELLGRVFNDGKDYDRKVNGDPELVRCVTAFDKDRLIGYLALVDRHTVHNFHQYLIGGAGNMVIDQEYRHLRLGVDMMSVINAILVHASYDIGMGFCTPELLKFYAQAGWILKPKGRIFARENGTLTDKGITVLYPTNQNSSEESFWFNDDINIGKSGW